jgi:hypothetical protein
MPECLTRGSKLAPWRLFAIVNQKSRSRSVPGAAFHAPYEHMILPSEMAHFADNARHFDHNRKG